MSYVINILLLTVKRDSIIDCNTQFCAGDMPLTTRFLPSQYMTMDNCIQLAVYQTPSPIPSLPPLI